MSRWLIAWVGASLLGVVNGTTRELLYKDRVSWLASAGGCEGDRVIDHSRAVHAQESVRYLLC